MAPRLGVLSAKTPKSLVEVAGEPFIVHQFRRFVSQGIRDVILCVGHLAETLESFVGDGSRFGVRVRYSFDGPVPLGTGGAVRKALSYVDHFFYVTYGDSYLEVDYRDVCARYLKSGLDAMMTVHRREGVREPGNARLENGRVVEYRKKNLTADLTHVDYGLLVMNKHVFFRPPREWARRFEPSFNHSVAQATVGGL